MMKFAFFFNCLALALAAAVAPTPTDVSLLKVDSAALSSAPTSLRLENKRSAGLHNNTAETPSGSARMLSNMARLNYYTIDPSSQPGLRWLHIPKCGQSLIITLAAYGCPGVDVPRMARVANKFHAVKPNGQLVSEVARKMKLGEICRRALVVRPFQGHVPLAPNERGIVGMLRDPMQRIISRLGHLLSAGMSKQGPLQIIQDNVGCYVRMLTGKDCSPPGNDAVATREATPAAVVALHDRFAWVGLVERWDESVCLFHARFATHASSAPFLPFARRAAAPTVAAAPQEFLNLHPGAKRDLKPALNPELQVNCCFSVPVLM
jgi:hypothetical protein